MHFDEVIHLEKMLLEKSTRKDVETLQKLIASDFLEIGSSGKIYNKSDVITSLLNEPITSFQATDFNLKPLNNEYVLLTYRLIEMNKKTSLRSSVWLFRKSHGWQMVFHQGTNCCL
jgi:hypothetical protein